MNRTDPFPQRQLRWLCALALLSPVLRLVPGVAAEIAGQAAWLGPLTALGPLLLYAWVLSRLRRGRRESLPELTLSALGPGLGRAVLGLLGGWLLLYCGFTLRAGAERFLVTVYPRATPAFFVVSMGLLALLAALGPLRSLLRVARMIAPVLLGALGLILLASLRGLEPSELLPVTPADAPALLGAGIPALDLGCFGLAALCFFRQEEEASPFRQTALWLGVGMLGLTALGGAIQGHFGPSLSARLSAPFFTLVRNLVFFRSLERMEALVVGLWIFPDFLLTGLSLQAAQRCLRLACGFAPQEGERRGDLSNGRWLIWLAGAAAIALGLLIAPVPEAMLLWSRRVIPAGSLLVALLLIPGILLAARRPRKKRL